MSIVTLGIVGYVLWRLVQTFFDPENRGQPINAKQIARRLGYACSAIGYTGSTELVVALLFIPLTVCRY